jgi:hypothetical protein
MEGRRIRLPVQLARRAEEPVDESLHSFYWRLLKAARTAVPKGGQWQLCEAAGWPDNPTHRNLAAWCWRNEEQKSLVVVNLSESPAQGRVPVPWEDLDGRTWRLTDLLAEKVYERPGSELMHPGLFVGLDGWGGHLLLFSRP